MKKLSTLNSQLSTQRGQTLIEVLASFGVAIVLVTAITVAILAALVNARSGKNRSLAMQYAQQGMEIIRQQRDSGVSFSNGAYCLIRDGTKKPVTDPACIIPDLANGFSFIREVSIVSAGSSECPTPPAGSTNLNKVTVTVRWSDNKCTGTGSDIYCNNVTLVSCLANPTSAQTP